MSVWVEMNPRQKLFKLRFVTLHVSVWVEMKWKILKTAPTMSRSTWACELKSLYSFRPSATCFVTLHVSVWVEIWLFVTGRVVFTVTLHVSVWVEMSTGSSAVSSIPSRSTWACELKSSGSAYMRCLGTSRSTWACELKCKEFYKNCKYSRSRSTWACELKYQIPLMNRWWTLSRSTWACELKCFLGKVRIYYWRHAPRERVSWNCETACQAKSCYSHAPRERVSWNYHWNIIQ